MALIPGSSLSMNSSGVVSGTANSLALARGQASATNTVAPALAAIDATDMAPSDKTSAKAKIVDAWNTYQAPLLLADSQAICAHLIARAEIAVDVVITPTNHGLQTLPTSIVAGAGTRGPDSDAHIDGTGTLS